MTGTPDEFKCVDDRTWAMKFLADFGLHHTAAGANAPCCCGTLEMMASFESKVLT